MFHRYANADVRELDNLATEWLVAHGCTTDGRPRGEVDPKQSHFDNRMAFVVGGAAYTERAVDPLSVH